jgi:hypothetical protein
MERSAWFIQLLPKGASLISTKTLFIQRPADFYPGKSLGQLRAENVVVRRERQTFRRLEKSEAVLFSVKTNLEKLVDMDEEDLVGLAMEIRSWPDEVACYRGRDVWGKCVLGFCDRKTGVEKDDPF